MPLYEYKCTNCETFQESLEKVDVEFIVCGVCGSQSRRVISASSMKVAGEIKFKPKKKMDPKSYVPTKIKRIKQD